MGAPGGCKGRLRSVVYGPGSASVDAIANQDHSCPPGPSILQPHPGRPWATIGGRQRTRTAAAAADARDVPAYRRGPAPVCCYELGEDKLSGTSSRARPAPGSWSLPLPALPLRARAPSCVAAVSGVSGASVMFFMMADRCRSWCCRRAGDPVSTVRAHRLLVVQGVARRVVQTECRPSPESCVAALIADDDSEECEDRSGYGAELRREDERHGGSVGAARFPAQTHAEPGTCGRFQAPCGSNQAEAKRRSDSSAGAIRMTPGLFPTPGCRRQ